MPSQTVLAEGKYLRLIQDNGWEYVERKNCKDVVAIVATTGGNEIILIEQYRPTMKSNVIEIPAGLVGDESDKNESIINAARRELLEETGYEAHELKKLIAGPSSTGLTNEVITYVVASGLEKKSDGGGIDHEKITIHKIPIAEAREWLKQQSDSGLMVDPRVYIGLYFLMQ